VINTNGFHFAFSEVIQCDYTTGVLSLLYSFYTLRWWVSSFAVTWTTTAFVQRNHSQWSKRNPWSGTLVLNDVELCATLWH